MPRTTLIDQDMTETSSSFAPASWSSSFGVSEALASYTRSQYIITSQNVASSLDTGELTPRVDEEAQLEVEPLEEDDLQTPMPDEPGLDSFEWDDVLNGPTLVQPAETESSPLIRKAPSRSSVRAQQSCTASGGDRLGRPPLLEQPKLRRKSSASASDKEVSTGRSTFGQTVSGTVFLFTKALSSNVTAL